MQENQRLFKEMYSKDILDMLARNEHERWMAYMRSIGYVYVSTKEVAITSKEINLKENDSMIIKNLYKTIDL